MEEQSIMETIRIAVIAVLVGLAAGAQADGDDVIAYVLNTRGVVEWRDAPDGVFKTLDPGVWLPAKAFVRTGEKSQCMLQYSDNSVTQVGENQGFDVGARSGLVRGRTSSLWGAVQRLVDKSSGEMTPVAAARSIGDITPLRALVPRSGVVGTELVMSWEGGSPEAAYQVSIRDDQGLVVWSATAAGNRRMTVNLDEARITRGREYTWRVAQNEAKADGNFRRLSGEEEKTLEKERKKWERQNLRGLDNDVRHAARAIFYLDNALYADAEREVCEAMKAAPDPSVYEPLLDALHRLGSAS